MDKHGYPVTVTHSIPVSAPTPAGSGQVSIPNFASGQVPQASVVAAYGAPPFDLPPLYPSPPAQDVPPYGVKQLVFAPAWEAGKPPLSACPRCKRHILVGMECPFCFVSDRTAHVSAPVLSEERTTFLGEVEILLGQVSERMRLRDEKIFDLLDENAEDRKKLDALRVLLSTTTKEP